MKQKELVKSIVEKAIEHKKNVTQIAFSNMRKSKLFDDLDYSRQLAKLFDLPDAAGLYMYLNDMIEPPKCIDCKEEIPRFISLSVGFLPRCKKCGTEHSHQVLSENNKHKSKETIEKLKHSLTLFNSKKKQERENQVYIELTDDNIKRAQDETQICYQKGYICNKMDNLKLNQIRREFPFIIKVIDSMRHENKVKTVTEGLYFLYHRLTEKPRCLLHLDDKCTDIVSFVNMEKGYNEACGQCSKHKPGASEKASQTYFQRTGFINPSKNPECMKLRGDNYEREHGKGIRHHMHTKEGQQKVINKILEKTDGKYSYMIQVPRVRDSAAMAIFEQHDEIQEKTVSKFRENYGVDRFCQTQEFCVKLRKALSNNPKRIQQILEDVTMLKELYNIELLEIPITNNQDVKYRCCVCNHEGIINITKIKSGNIWVCPICHPYHGNQSKAEYDVSCIIKKELPDEVFEFSNRKILNGKEIDIYYPNRNIAIEYSGLKYHSSHLSNDWSQAASTVSEDYHYQKWLGCKNKGINLITIFDDEWIIKKYRIIAIKSLLYKFGIYKNVIKIEDCQIVKIHDSKIIYKFLSDNCLDRFDDFDHSYGVMYNNIIIAMFCFNDYQDHYNIRYCNDKDYRIVNDFMTLLNRFKTEYSKKDIVYSINRDWMDIPFEFENCGFTIYNDDMNLNKYYWGLSLWKRKMIQDFNDENLEVLNAEKLNWVYDCGNVIYKL